ncbi:MAG: hypothetical protein HUU37_02985 [Bdellovibrionales bacterium]|nr:hypothetical protein [Bdellovibrionales bacterium]
MSASLHNPHPQKLPKKLGKLPTPVHLYFQEHLEADAHAIRGAFKQKLSRPNLHFSVKTCPLPRLLRDLSRVGWGFEVVSEADLTMVERAKANKKSVMASPLYPDERLLLRLLKSPLVRTIHLESPAAVLIVADLLRRHKALLARGPQIGLRIHSGSGHFGFAPNAGTLEPPIRSLLAAGARVRSLQIHTSSEGGAITTERFRGWFSHHLPSLLEAKKIAERLQDSPVEHLDFGGGIEHPATWRVPVDRIGEYHSGKIPPAAQAPRPPLEEIASAAAEGLHESLLRAGLENLPVSFELGRAVCSRSLSTLLSVGSVKGDLYPDASILLTDGNTSLLGPLHRVLLPFEHFSAHQPSATTQRCFIYGNLPHASDWLYQNVELHGPHAGDKLLIRHTGAYFLSQEAQFGHPRPEVRCAASGRVIRKAETVRSLLQRDRI